MMVRKQLPRGSVNIVIVRGSFPEVFLRKCVLKFTGEHPCRSVISIKLQSKNYSKNWGSLQEKN